MRNSSRQCSSSTSSIVTALKIKKNSCTVQIDKGRFKGLEWLVHQQQCHSAKIKINKNNSLYSLIKADFRDSSSSSTSSIVTAPAYTTTNTKSNSFTYTFVCVCVCVCLCVNVCVCEHIHTHSHTYTHTHTRTQLADQRPLQLERIMLVHALCCALLQQHCLDQLIDRIALFSLGFRVQGGGWRV